MYVYINSKINTGDAADGQVAGTYFWANSGDNGDIAIGHVDANADADIKARGNSENMAIVGDVVTADAVVDLNGKAATLHVEVQGSRKVVWSVTDGSDVLYQGDFPFDWMGAWLQEDGKPGQLLNSTA